VTGGFTLYAGWEEVVEHHGTYLSGYPDGRFHPEGKITRAEAAQIFYDLLENSGPSGGFFPDVTQGAWCYDAMTALSGLGIVNGYRDGRFGPNHTITRTEAVTITNRVLGCSGLTECVSFADVPATHWACEAITAAATGHTHE